MMTIRGNIIDRIPQETENIFTLVAQGTMPGHPLDLHVLYGIGYVALGEYSTVKLSSR